MSLETGVTFMWPDRFSWVCGCTAEGRKLFISEFDAERAYERHISGCSVSAESEMQ